MRLNTSPEVTQLGKVELDLKPPLSTASHQRPPVLAASTCALQHQPGTTFRMTCSGSKRTSVGLPTQLKSSLPTFPNYWPEVLVLSRKLISASQSVRYYGIQQKWKKYILSSQDAYKVHSYETADTNIRLSRWVCGQMGAIMGSWKISVDGVNQGRLPRGDHLQEKWGSHWLKKATVFLRATTFLEKSRHGIHNA